jgi:hypothetical protein
MKKHTLKVSSFSFKRTSASRLVRASLLLFFFTVLLTSNTSPLAACAGGEGRVRQYAFELQGRVVAKGSDPQLGVRASGELFLLLLKDGNIWLQTSADGGDSFEGGVRVNDGGEIASHSENTPQMVVRTMREFYVFWSMGDGHEHTDLRLAGSTDWGRSFGKPVAVDPTGTASQSFYTLAVAPDGAIYAAWLDGRERGQGRQGSSAVYIARSINRGQSFEKSVRVAFNVCPCCRPAIAFGENKTVYVGWRGVFDRDIRDVLIAASTDGGATFGSPTRVAEDNWQINGCPHSGPSLATLGGRLFVAWHTVSSERSHLYIASSSDNGAHFSSKVEADTNLLDANHPRLLRLDDTVGMVFQARQANSPDGWGKQDIYFRQIDKSGSLSSLHRLGHAAGSATYPAILFESPDHIFVAWTEGTEDGRKVVLARGRAAAPRQAMSAQSATVEQNTMSFSTTP